MAAELLAAVHLPPVPDLPAPLPPRPTAVPRASSRILFMSKKWPVFFQTLGIVLYAAVLNIPKSRASLVEISLVHCLFYC